MIHDTRFQRLTERLAEGAPLWRCLPFQEPEPAWRSRWPGLAEALLALGDDALARLQADPFASAALADSPLAAWLPVEALAELVALPDLSRRVTLPETWAEGVAERKRRQLEAFVPQVALACQGAAGCGAGQLVEWCAGKGHLARALAQQHAVEVAALEWDPALCAAGRTLAEQQGAAVRFHLQDVMASSAARWLRDDSLAVALHACGDLHRHLLQLVVATGSDVVLAPCCYQRTADADYRPLSARGRELAAAAGLTLGRDDLALAVQETVTAPRSVQRHRERAAAWRLGFDLLQRRVRGVDRYLPVPSLAYGRMPARFADFCRWAARQKDLLLPKEVDWCGLEAEGWRRQREVARLELVRHLYRRPLEIWLVLDRLIFLEEAGYRVVLGTFCRRELTPRNLVLHGCRA